MSLVIFTCVVGLLIAPIKVNFFNADGIAAAAGFTSNVLDLAKFARWQLNLVGSSEKNILSPEVLIPQVLN